MFFLEYYMQNADCGALIVNYDILLLLIFFIQFCADEAEVILSVLLLEVNRKFEGKFQ